MKILAYKPGHDGSVTYIKDGKLIYCVEAEKDSHTRHSPVGPSDFLDTLAEVDEFPDSVCLSGWSKGRTVYNQPLGAGYNGIANESIISVRRKFFGKEVNYFSSSHERSHILCAFGLSELPKGQPCYALVWEGSLGTFYEIDEKFNIKSLGSPMTEPGNRYAFIYALADPSFSATSTYIRLSDAGKLMALASYSKRAALSNKELELIDIILHQTPRLTPMLKEKVKDFPHYNVGVEDDNFKNFAGVYSDTIFNIFYDFAKQNMTKNFPLLIAGGCGLNCDWNTLWRECGLFPSVFVPPVANDSGSSIGTAIDAMRYYTNEIKLDWNVYSGLEFNCNLSSYIVEFDVLDRNNCEVANMLAKGLILAWVQDKYEIGPRALGNRSLLAAPFSEETKYRLNVIKQREQFRPIAPLCLESDAKESFGCKHSSPYMLYFYKVRTNKLKAITHVDNTARIQTVSPVTNKKMFDLLQQFKKITGYGVLCNTSLNFKGTGFINNTADLHQYVIKHNLDGCVIGNKCYLYKKSKYYKKYLSYQTENFVS